MSQLDVEQAAAALGVSHVQVCRLIDAGELVAQRFGRSWAIDADSLRRYRLLRPRPGRPLSEQASWELLLGAEPSTDLDEAVDLARLVRRRSSNERLRILPALTSEIDDDPRVRHGGAHAAIHHGAATGQPAWRDVYISVGDAESFRADYRATPMAVDPNVVLRMIARPVAFPGRFVPPIVALVDLLDAADVRAAAEVLRVLR